MQALDPLLVTLAQEGSKAYRERFDLLYRREASQPNEIWQADHTPLDIGSSTSEASQPVPG
jgi:putative transposase